MVSPVLTFRLLALHTHIFRIMPVQRHSLLLRIAACVTPRCRYSSLLVLNHSQPRLASSFSRSAGSHQQNPRRQRRRNPSRRSNPAQASTAAVSHRIPRATLDRSNLSLHNARTNSNRSSQSPHNAHAAFNLPQPATAPPRANPPPRQHACNAYQSDAKELYFPVSDLHTSY